MANTAPRVWLTTLGCAKNRVDSEKILGRLGEAGYATASSLDSADVVMVNTCGFIEPARTESVDTILQLAGEKRDDASLVVIGCMAQRYEAELAAALPEADAVIGLARYAELVERIDEMRGWTPPAAAPRRRPRMDILFETRRPAPASPYAYVKVAEGCNRGCTFCAIPQFRGRQRSRTPANVRDEVERLVAGGVTEVGLVAQDLTAYGRDADGFDLLDLLGEVTNVEGLRLIRLYYLYPRDVRPVLIDAIVGNPGVADYFDLSLQHTSPRLLRAMGRPGSGEDHAALIRRIRDGSRDAALRSSFIVGFPGETDEEVDELESFLREARLDWAGFFAFSPEEGTPAAEMEGRIPESETAERLRHLQRVQDDITGERTMERVGSLVRVVVDQVEESRPVARSYRHAPEIDGVILLDRGEPGEWLTAEIVGGYGTDSEAVVRGPA